MIDYFKSITVSHKLLNTNELGNFVIRFDSNQKLANELAELKQAFRQDEIIYLATCNRVTIVFYGAQPMSSSDAINLFRRVNPLLNQKEHLNLQKVIQLKTGLNAIDHILEVMSSIDSLVVGEREIFRQFREAFDFSVAHKLSGDNMRILERCAVVAAKDIFTKTDIGAKPVSVASLAIQEFLNRDLDRHARILLVGSGETNTKVGRFLKKHGYSNIVIFNRSLDNAKMLSEELDAEAYYLTELDGYSQSFEAIVTCTASQDPIITPELWLSLNPNQSKKIIIDLAVPNNVSQEVSQLPGLDYISISTIQKLADQNIQFRNSNIAAARILLRPHVDEFSHMYERRKVTRAFSQLPAEILAVKERALNNVYKDQIASLPEDAQELISEICSYMEKKCVAVPMKLAKSAV